MTAEGMDQRPMAVEIKKADATELQLAATEKHMAEVVAELRSRKWDARPLTVKVAELLPDKAKPSPASAWDDRPLSVKLSAVMDRIEQSKRG
jgi:hypothetical protein